MNAVTSAGTAPAPDGESDGHVDDLVFVGAGASAAYTLVSLLDSLGDRPGVRPLRIRVVDPAPDAFSGIPYGSRAASTSLLITSLRDFLPELERTLFAAWLTMNKDWVFDDFRAAGGPASRRWWNRHAQEISRDDFDALFLPRYTFGRYLSERTFAAITRAERAGVAQTQVVADHISTIGPDGAGWALTARDRRYRASRIVLAVGSPPAMARLSRWAGATGAALIDDPFRQMNATLARVGAALDDSPAGRSPHVVLVGGNASTMDLLYLLGDLPEARHATFTVVSPRPLPPSVSKEPGTVSFVAKRLAALDELPDLRAIDIYQEALADIARGERRGLSAAATIGVISRAVAGLLPRLSPAQASEFAGRWGAELGRRQRRAGWEYCEVVESLTQQGRFRHISGRFTGLRPDDHGVRLRTENAGIVTEWPEPADVVVNCAGPAGDLRVSAPPLLTQLIGDGICDTTAFGVGLAVGPSLEAATGLHVMGPLLAGNVLESGPLWHMEHCGRISTSGRRLGIKLAELLAP